MNFAFDSFGEAPYQPSALHIYDEMTPSEYGTYEQHFLFLCVKIYLSSFPLYYFHPFCLFVGCLQNRTPARINVETIEQPYFFGGHFSRGGMFLVFLQNRRCSFLILRNDEKISFI
jgi:hypothetical protein